MAMPASGTIAIICNTCQTCSSIAVAVDGNCTPPKSLCTLSASAGKSTPHAMSEFYGFTSKTPINLVQYQSYGTQGSSAYVYRYFCLSPTPAAGQTYSACIRGDLCTIGQAAGSYSFIRVTCNNVTKCQVCVQYNVCCPVYVTAFTVDSTDCVRICNRSCATNTACIGATGVKSSTCLFSVTGTYHSKGTTCVLGYACTG